MEEGGWHRCWTPTNCLSIGALPFLTSFGPPRSLTLSYQNQGAVTLLCDANSIWSDQIVAAMSSRSRTAHSTNSKSQVVGSNTRVTRWFTQAGMRFLTRSHSKPMQGWAVDTTMSGSPFQLQQSAHWLGFVRVTLLHKGSKHILPASVERTHQANPTNWLRMSMASVWHVLIGMGLHFGHGSRISRTSPQASILQVYITLGSQGHTIMPPSSTPSYLTSGLQGHLLRPPPSRITTSYLKASLLQDYTPSGLK